MSWYFNKTNERYVTMGDDAALTLPNGDWTIAGWVKLVDNTGSSFKYFLSWGAFGANPSINVWIAEASLASPTAQRNKLTININGTQNYGSVNIGSTTTWQHVMLQRSGTTVTVYINGSADFTISLSAASDVAAALYWGIREDLNADRRYKGYLAEWAKWDRALSSAERTDLVAGLRPDNLTTDLAWYCPMYDDFSESVVPLTVTNVDATAHSDEHPTMYDYSPPDKVTTPSPADAATDEARPVTLSWAAAATADSYDVYFGTSEADVTAGTGGTSKGNQAGITYSPGTLSAATTYYWRIDAVNAYGTTTGDVWSFTTEADPITIVALYSTVRNSLLSHLFGKSTYTAPSIYAGIGDDDGNEPTIGGYARVLAATWGDAVAGVTLLGGAIEFPVPTGNWGRCSTVVFYDAATGGNFLGAGTLTTARTITSGGSAPEFPVGSIAFTLSGPLLESIRNAILDHFFGKAVLTVISECWLALADVSDGEPTQAAAGALTMDTLPTDGDTVTIDGTTYRFKDTPAAANDIQIGTTVGSELSETQENLVAAINGTGTEGVEYYAGTTAPHASVWMRDFASDIGIVIASTAGAGGNSIATTSSFTAGTNGFDAATLGTVQEGGALDRQHLQPADWADPVDGYIYNAAQIDFDAPTSDWGTMTQTILHDAATAGNALSAAALATAKAVNSGSPAPAFHVAALRVLII